jgi:DNA-binding NarL/FixJ family response regulator
MAITASSGAEARPLVREQQPTLALVQARLPDEGSLLLIETLASGPNPILTVLLCRHPSDLQTRLAWAFGARGAASEDSGLPRLLETLKQLSAGREVFFGGAPPDCTRRERALLRPTRQQLAVLRQYAITPLRKAVASAVGLSLNTVDDHLHRLCRKLEADSHHDLVHHAIELGLIPSPMPRTAPPRATHPDPVC